MSTAKWGKKWADVDDEEEDLEQLQPSNRFETNADAGGIKTVVEYIERDQKTYRVTRKVRVRAVQKWTNKAMEERKGMAKFGKAAQADPAEEAQHMKRTDEEYVIEVPKKAVSLVTKDDAEDRFYEESLDIAQQLTKEKKAWAEANRDKQLERDTAEADKKTEPTPAEAPSAAGGPAKYVPPALKQGGGKAGGKGDLQGQQEASLRITNLSEDVREGDLQELFSQFGRLQRVYLAKHMDTMQSKGFAFVTYFKKEDAQLAIDKLNGHGYDSLILQVQWAKPRT
mmetsp:Transcript_21616/g.39642  ORF Transcript_21616/g.39642 Transcript_21616/m.39642 type:complete len:283 (-) Transcript_21616:125-973(-)